MYRPYDGPDYSNPDHEAYFNWLCGEVKRMATKKPIWKKFKFWLPVVTGLVTAGSVAARYVLDVEVPEEVTGWLIAGGLTLLSVILGVDWSEHEELQ